MHIFGELVHIFGELAHIFGKLVHIFARKLVSRTSKQVSKNLGPLWQPGVYNDTKLRCNDYVLRAEFPSKILLGNYIFVPVPGGGHFFKTFQPPGPYGAP